MTKMAASGINMRMLMYTLTVVLHVSNMVYMLYTVHYNFGDTDDPIIKTFFSLQTRVFSCWVFFFQIVYAILGLVCDGLTLKNVSNEEYQLPKYLKDLRELCFCAVIWPCTWVVFLIFWSLYHYDKSLIMLPFVEEMMSPMSNHIMHSFIVPVVLWEVAFQPRAEPQSHKRNLFVTAFILATYSSLTIYTYMETGIWMYPLLKVTYGTIYFPIVHLTAFTSSLILYWIQWPLARICWAQKTKEKVK